MSSSLQRLLREPLFHFAVLGGLIFAVFVALNGRGDPPADVIVISSDRIAQIAEEYEAVWRRQPTADELDSLIEEDIREEVYYREALALGLDQNDVLVRRRMRLKMEFLMDSTANAITPAAGELEAYLAANETLYLLEARLAFDQIYLGESPEASVITSGLQHLRTNPTLDPQTLAQHTMLPPQLGLSSAGVVSGIFGKGFFEQIAEAGIGEWVGPVTSSYGAHLVRVLDALPRRAPRLEEVRDDVLRDWKMEKAGEVHDRDYARRRARFIIEVNRAEAQMNAPSESPE